LDRRGQGRLLLLKGKIVTVDQEFTIAEAVAVKNGRVVAVGPSGQMEDWRGGNTEVIDLGGKTVLPGLIDSHIHMVEPA